MVIALWIGTSDFKFEREEMKIGMNSIPKGSRFDRCTLQVTVMGESILL